MEPEHQLICRSVRVTFTSTHSKAPQSEVVEGSCQAVDEGRSAPSESAPADVHRQLLEIDLQVVPKGIITQCLPTSNLRVQRVEVAALDEVEEHLDGRHAEVVRA